MRKLSSYQQKPWMDKIAKNRKYFHQAKGEQHWGAKLTEKFVLLIRAATPSQRFKFCGLGGISERHWYLIRAKKRWKHLA